MIGGRKGVGLVTAQGAWERTTAHGGLGRRDKGTEVTVWLRVKSGKGELITSSNPRTRRVSREERTEKLTVSAMYMNITPIYVAQTMRGKQITDEQPQDR